MHEHIVNWRSLVNGNLGQVYDILLLIAVLLTFIRLYAIGLEMHCKKNTKQNLTKVGNAL